MKLGGKETYSDTTKGQTIHKRKKNVEIYTSLAL